MVYWAACGPDTQTDSLAAGRPTAIGDGGGYRFRRAAGNEEGTRKPVLARPERGRFGSSDVEAAAVAAARHVPIADAGGHRQGRQPLLHPRRGSRRRHEGEAVGRVQGRRPGLDHRSSRVDLLAEWPKEESSNTRGIG